MCLYQVNLEAEVSEPGSMWLENKSKLAIQMAYMGMVQFFPDIISHLNFGAVETRMTTSNTPHTWVVVCVPQVLWHLPISSSRILEENVFFVLKNNITRAAQSLLCSTSAPWHLDISAFRNITQKGCPTDESGAVGWILDGPYDCRTGGDWGQVE